MKHLNKSCVLLSLALCMQLHAEEFTIDDNTDGNELDSKRHATPYPGVNRPNVYAKGTSGNKITITDPGGNFQGDIMFLLGAYSTTDDVENNTVIVNGAYMGVSNNQISKVIGGQTDGNKASNNKVSVEGSSIVYGDVIGGKAKKEATKNEVDLKLSNYQSIDSITKDTVGGEVNEDASGSKATDNTINVYCTECKFGNLIGGRLADGKTTSAKGADLKTGNTLNFNKVKDVRAKSIKNFDKINFTLQSGTERGDTILKLTSTNPADKLNLTGVKIGLGIEDGADTLKKDDQVNLIKSAQEIEGDAPSNSTISVMTGLSTAYTFTLQKSSDNKNLVAKVASKVDSSTPPPPPAPPPAQPKPNDIDKPKLTDEQLDELIRSTDHKLAGDLRARQKNVAETSIGAMGMLNQSVDTLSKVNITPANNNYGVFNGVGANKVRYDSGSHVDARGVSFVIGLGKDISSYQKDTTIGLFLEVGAGTYKSYNSLSNGDNAKGDGKMEYYGFGAIGKMDMGEDMYSEASFKFGRIYTDYESIITQNLKASYEVKRMYFGAHYGAGKVMNLDEKSNVDIYTKAFANFMTSKTIQPTKDTKMKLGAGQSLVAKIGAKYNYKFDENYAFFGGLATDVELLGKAKAKNLTYNTSIKAPSAQGITASAEVGTKIMSAQNLQTDVKIEGMIGKRRGINGGLEFRYKF